MKVDVNLNLDEIKKLIERDYNTKKPLLDLIASSLAESILNQAKENVPYDTGALHDSLRLNSYKTKKAKGYRVSANTDYALKVHEEPQSKRKTGKHRYLAIAMDSTFNDNFDT